MRRTITALILLGLFAASASALSETKNSEGPLSGFSPEQQKKLLSGEPVFEFKKTSAEGQDDQGHGQAYIIINAPLDTCFKIFSALDLQYQYFPRKTKSEVVKKEGDRVLLRNEFDFYLADIYYTSEYTIDPKRHRFDFEMDKSFPHNLEESAGFFEFEKLDDNRTLFTYAATKVDTGVRVPGFIQEYITSRDLPAQAVNVKKRIESGGKWTKD